MRLPIRCNTCMGGGRVKVPIFDPGDYNIRLTDSTVPVTLR